MKINVEDLMVGDEIIIPSNSNFKYVKVIQQPKESLKKHWKTGKTLFKSVRCSIKSQQEILPITKWRKKQGIRNKYEFEQDTSKHNIRISIDLNYASIWLVKREAI